MKIVLLPGNSAYNKEWIEKVEESLLKIYESSYLQYYRHWKTGGGLIDSEYEKAVLIKEVGHDKDFDVFAKSAGIIVALKAILERSITPRKCIFVGLPLKWARANNMPLERLFENLTIPILFIQKDNDPVCSFLKLRKFIEKVRITNASFFELPGDDHDYMEIGEIRKTVKDFIAGQ